MRDERVGVGKRQALVVVEGVRVAEAAREDRRGDGDGLGAELGGGDAPVGVGVGEVCEGVLWLGWLGLGGLLHKRGDEGGRLVGTGGL